MKAIIVDENRESASFISKILNFAGFMSLHASSYDDALAGILNEEITMAFAPAYMRGSDISIFLSKLRSFANLKKAQIPVIAVSNMPMASFFELFSELDLFGYIEKPASVSELVIVARQAGFYAENFNGE